MHLNMPCRAYSPEELSILKGSFQGMPAKRLMELLPGRSYDSIRKKAQKIGLKHGFDHHWTEQEESIVRKSYPTASKKYLFDLLRSMIPGDGLAIEASTENLVSDEHLLLLSKVMEKATLPLSSRNIDKIEHTLS